MGQILAQYSKNKVSDFMKISNKVYMPLKKDEFNIRRDDVFKIIFGSEDRSEFLKAFLESIYLDA